MSIVINLTVHHAHREVTARCLEAGKHVFSEKPLAMTFAEAQDLVALAREKGVRLGCAPFTFMGEAQQTAWKWIRDGRLGKVRVAFAEVNWGRIETWHPAPEPFYEVGAVFDVGVYPLTLLTTIFGPARRVSAYGTVLLPERVTKTGQSYHLQTADFVVAVLEMADGTVVRLTSDFYVTQHTKQVGVEFHGDLGSLYLSSWAFFDASVEFAGFGQPYQRAPLLKEPRKGIPWDQGVLDLVDAINTGRPHQATGEQAAHVVEIMCATSESIQRQAPVAIHSSFMPPSPLPWALP